ncbi:HK97 gp10 family phage protein [Micromonospora sp. CPCC 206060]|uniref:HK97 gp10 family phage protein n=1 Tax=Micromonospora sp. CPCC 206060 TaxID=3122406 RepID=UPI002FEFF089
MALIEPIRVDGLAQFSRNLRKLDNELPKALRIAMNEGAEIVVDEAVPRIPRVTGAAARSVKARSTRTAVRVSAGSKRVGYFPWLDFGGEGRIKGRPAKREFIKEGRYLWSSYGDRRDEVAAALERALLSVVAAAGVEVD